MFDVAGSDKVDTEVLRVLLAKKCMLYVACLIAFATVVRPMFVEQSMVFTYIGVFNSCLGLSFYFYISPQIKKVTLSFIIIFYSLLALVPLLVISGGVNSQFSVIFPIIPIFICLLVYSAKAAWLMCVMLTVLVVALLVSEMHLPNYTEEIVSESKTKSRAFWIVLSTILSTIFSVEFLRITNIYSTRLNRQANMDVLTKISNRRSVLKSLYQIHERSLLEGEAYAVIMLDIDFFKRINDQYGHSVGDQVLVHVAKILETSLRTKGDSVGRYGGEEFLIILSDVTAEQAENIANKILETLESAPFLFKDNSITITATVGICCSEVGQLSAPETLINHADTALYQGKKEGRNRVICCQH
ncbi:GGDEF domain-containing protein [Marinomonas sp. C2222]|uniref:diguanylate cyclase n=1 Tax=Marinomonas sargassi TaxID=2984494 RepID=A0ABT2YRK5_9GAMM|nr:GGDEF domain-containing protein [Marinomonas sargassi]MCV2402501.1 GGDEF domain-containing protein [Marinomonas sargassi]